MSKQARLREAEAQFFAGSLVLLFELRWGSWKLDSLVGASHSHVPQVVHERSEAVGVVVEKHSPCHRAGACLRGDH